ncbi:hypothetical protein [Clostridium sp.]|uniref:hypothetical protein n=1 Tax=Clostridium sp. TaxID=1506 RepID=UPI003F3DF564
MNHKKILSLLLTSALLFTFVGCSNSNDNKEDNKTPIQEEQPSVEEVPEITTFEALGRTYSSTKDIKSFEASTEVYNDHTGNSHVFGEYKEIDFASDLLVLYVNGNEDVYNYLVSYDPSSEDGLSPITEDDKAKLKKDLASLREQMGLAESDEMILKVDMLTYEGASKETNTGVSLKIRVAISAVGDSVVPWNYFNVTVFEQGNKLVAYLF